MEILLPACCIQSSWVKCCFGEKKGGNSESICLHLVWKIPPEWWGWESQGRRELGCVNWKSYCLSLTPIPASSFGTAQERCMAVGTNCNSLRKVFISTATHGHQMCWGAKAGGRHPGKGAKPVASLQIQESAFCASVYWVREMGRDNEILWNNEILSQSLTLSKPKRILYLL